MFPLRSNLVQVAQLEEYMKTLDTNLAPLSEALGTMMECNQVWEKASWVGVQAFVNPRPPVAGAWSWARLNGWSYADMACAVSDSDITSLEN